MKYKWGVVKDRGYKLFSIDDALLQSTNPNELKVYGEYKYYINI